MSLFRALSQKRLMICHIYSSVYLKNISSVSRNSSRISFKVENYRNFSIPHQQLIYTVNTGSYVNSQRNYSKKKKISKKSVEEEEESESDEDEVYENLGGEELDDGSSTFTKSVPSMRIDTIAKAAFGTSKKKIEKEFYSSNIRVNGEKILKKAFQVAEGDEIDLIKGFSSENDKLLEVDRIVVKFIGKISGTGNYPVTMQVFKALPIENYPDPWVKSSV